MEAINWPKEFTPGFTDNFLSVETIVKDLSAEQVFPYLTHAYIWPEYYGGTKNVVSVVGSEKVILNQCTKFNFNILGWDVQAEIV